MNKKFERYLLLPTVISVILIVVNVPIYFQDKTAGLIMTGGMILYIVVSIFLYRMLKPRLSKEMMDYATQYGMMQKTLLEDFDVPYAMLDADGKILWQNQKFLEYTGTEKDYHKSITTLFPSITKELLYKIPDEYHLYLAEDDIFYHVSLKRTYLFLTKDDDKEEARQEHQYLYAMYLFDETQLQESLKENEDQKLVTALVYIDNYDEAMDSIEEVKRSLLVALIERRINKYFTNIDGIVKKVEKDKYFVVFKKKFLSALEEDRFSLIEDVKTVKIGNEMAITLSIGVGNSNYTYTQSYEFTRAAIDLALGRGGDQVVVKANDKISYYGGKTQQVDKSTRVKARIKAQALREIFETKEQVMVMGHPIGDVDSFGASIGIYQAATALGKRAYIVINEINSSLRPIKELYNEANGYSPRMFLTGEEAKEIVDRNTVVVVVDTNKPSYTECPDLLTMAKTVVVFDHHRQGTETIENAVLSYIEPYASSTCEMISEVLQYFSENIKLDGLEADTLYAGILIDTNNFLTKTGVRTFEAAAYLKRSGADVNRVRKMMRNDIQAYKARAEAVRNAEVYHGEFAITAFPGDKVESPTIAAAQAANELLNIIGIKASFVLTDYQGKIYISSRSIDEVNVQLIMERLGGGGHLNVAGTQLSEISLEKAKQVVKDTIDEMLEKGEI